MMAAQSETELPRDLALRLVRAKELMEQASLPYLFNTRELPPTFTLGDLGLTRDDMCRAWKCQEARREKEEREGQSTS